MELINWNILKHPMNWVILFLMILIAGFALHLVLTNLPTVATETV